MKFPSSSAPIVPILNKNGVELFLKREDLIHPEISGNKFWKLFFNIQNYQNEKVAYPLLITFGGAFSNHIAAVAKVGQLENMPTLGIIRGEELKYKWQENATLQLAHQNGMDFRFVKREEYRNKESLTKNFESEYPAALIILEGGTNEIAVEGIQYMLNSETKRFDYLCTAVGTGGTIAGISKFAEENQQVIGFKVVDDISLEKKVLELSTRNNFKLIEAHDGGYGKINEENIRFINDFKEKFNIPLDPVYTGKMLRKIFQLIDEDYFPEGSKILAFHTGGLQGISGANELLRKKNRELIKY